MATDDGYMNEAHFREIEKVMLYISEARAAAESSAKTIAKDDADDHLVIALESTEQALAKLHTALMQSTFFAVPSDQDDMFKVERIRKKFAV